MGLDPGILTDGLPIDTDYLRNARNWLPRDMVIEIFNRCEKLFDDPLIMYKIGQHAWLTQEGTFTRLMGLFFINPRISILYGPRLVSFLSKFHRMEGQILGLQTGRYIFHWNDNSMAHRHGCYYIMGWIVGFFEHIWKTRAWVWEEECVLDQEMESIRQLEKPAQISPSTRFGSSCCSYRFEWVEPHYASSTETLFDENEDLVTDALVALESMELSLQEKEAKLEDISREYNSRQEKRGSFLEQYGLTPREIQVALLVARGKNNYEIADTLFISTETVKKHLNNIFQKMDVKSRSALTAKIYDTSWPAPHVMGSSG